MAQMNGTLKHIQGQSFVINPFPRCFQLVLVDKIVARAATEIGTSMS